MGWVPKRQEQKLELFKERSGLMRMLGLQTNGDTLGLGVGVTEGEGVAYKFAGGLLGLPEDHPDTSVNKPPIRAATIVHVPDKAAACNTGLPR
jgi:hypothetical protein